MRNIAVVIQGLLLIIPKGETHFRFRLIDILEDRWNSPEALWYKGARAFTERFGEIPPESGWGKAAVDLWMGREREGEREGDADDGGLGSAVIENIPPTRRVPFFEHARTFFRGLSRRSFQ